MGIQRIGLAAVIGILVPGFLIHGEDRGTLIRVTGRAITSLRQIAVNTKSVDWSETLDLIAFERVGPRRYFEVYTMKPDGSGERCLTCEGGAPRKHNGSPSWHPTGKYILFGAEKPETPANLDDWAVPGKGANCDLWVMTADGKKYWRLTNLPLRTGRDIQGVIHPQFSRDGKKVMWAERLGGGGSWGRWVLRVAEFKESPEPHLEQVKMLDPGGKAEGGGQAGGGGKAGGSGQAEGGGQAGGISRMMRGRRAAGGGPMPPFYETHDFSPDSSKILFSANLLKGQPQHGLDICELTLATGAVKRLTDTFDDWDEHAHYSPDGRKVAWMSSTGLDIQWGDTSGNRWKRFVKTELWLMNADGSGKERLTYFNDPGAPEYFGKRCIVADSAWSPDGRRLLVNVAYEAFPNMQSKCYVLDLK